MAFGNTSLATAVTRVPTQEPGGQLAGLDLALERVGLKLSLLTTAIESLTLKLSSLRLLSQSAGAGAKSEPASGQKSAGSIEPPDLLKPAIAMDSALADLKQAGKFTPRQTQEMAQGTQRIAIAPLISAGATQAVDLVRIESLAARAGIGGDLPDPADRQSELLRFASDVGVAASAFKMPAMEVAEMMLGWRTSMKLTGAQAFDLADAANHLGKLPGGAKPGDIGAVLQRDGAAATAAGLAPAQAAALTAALLGSGSQKDEAGAALRDITTVMGKGNQTSVTERAAWRQLALDPKAVASGLRDKDTASGTVMSVLAAVNAQPAEQRTALAATLFGNSDEAVLRMAQKLADVNDAFGQVNDKAQYATSELGNKGSVRQDAWASSQTRQGQWNNLNARNDRALVAAGNALAPTEESSLQGLGALADGMGDLAESSPKAAAAIVLVAAAIKPLVGALLKAVTDELSSRVGKRVVGGVASRLPERMGEMISEDVAKGRTARLDIKDATVNAAKAEAGMGSDPSLRGVSASVRSLTRFIPAAAALTAVPEVVDGVMSGDARKVGAGLGAAGGGWAGAEAGAIAGATIGTFFGPGLGTAIGGALGAVVGGLAGGCLGSETGAWLGEKLTSPADTLAAPEQVSKDLTSTQTTSQQNTMTANIYINGQDQASASQLANLVVRQLTGQFGLTTMPNSLAMRSDAALTDGVT
ncbi:MULTISPECIES: phage tail tape measure protein [Pseudomonas]|uniref:phage tail tape measure protein n=1 Tax=Pseudomonas TaxID=286 RepID=UPI001E476F89|nr:MULTISPECIES: phage tail tape measure protein [Pseudomonas]MCD4529219.1 phage tail tape measure protein [Pseudomonas sp. C3-2018]